MESEGEQNRIKTDKIKKKKKGMKLNLNQENQYSEAI